MLRSDVERLVDSWLIGDRYVFKTYNYFSLDYLVIERKREDEFECDRKASTTDMGTFNRDEIVRMISANIFIHQLFERPDQDFRQLRSGGCTCGGYKLAQPSHAHGCKFYRPY